MSELAEATTMSDPINEAIPSPDALLKLIGRQLRTYRRLHRLVRKQGDLVGQEDPTDLISLLAERHRLTADLGATSKCLAPYRRDWERHRARLSPEQKVEAEAMLGEIESTLKTIVSADEEDVKRLQIRKQSVATELGGFANRQAVLNAYGRPNATRPAVLNRTDSES